MKGCCVKDMISKLNPVFFPDISSCCYVFTLFFIFAGPIWFGAEVSEKEWLTIAYCICSVMLVLYNYTDQRNRCAIYTEVISMQGVYNSSFS